MSRTPYGLTNCYIPLPVSVLKNQQQQKQETTTTTQSTATCFKNKIRSNQRDSGDQDPSKRSLSAPSSFVTTSDTTKTTTTVPPPPTTSSSSSTTTTTTTSSSLYYRENHSFRPIHIESYPGKTTSTDPQQHQQNQNQDTVVTSSSYVEFGRTKVICQIIGPITACSSSSNSQNHTYNTLPYHMDHGIIHVDVKYSSVTSYPIELIAKNQIISGVDMNTSTNTTTNTTQQQQTTPVVTLQNSRMNQILQNRESELGKRILTTLTPSLVPVLTSKQYSKTAIILKFIILQDDGCPLPVCVTAASIALTQANIELYDIITACTVAVIAVPIIQTTDDNNNNNNNKNNDTTMITTTSTTDTTKNRTKKYEFYYLVDPTLEERNHASMILTMGLMCNWKDVTCWEQQQYVHYNHDDDDVDNMEMMTNTAIELCFKGCQTLNQFIRKHLLVSSSTSSS